MKKLFAAFVLAALMLAASAQAGVLKVAAYPIRHTPVQTVKKVMHLVWRVVY